MTKKYFNVFIKRFTPPFRYNVFLNTYDIGVAGRDGERRQCAPEAGRGPATLPRVQGERKASAAEAGGSQTVTAVLQKRRGARDVDKRKNANSNGRLVQGPYKHTGMRRYTTRIDHYWGLD